MSESKPVDDPTKRPKAPRAPSESTPPAGGDSMQPADSQRPAAGHDARRERGKKPDIPEPRQG